jgi:hypothetical protein
MGPRSAGRGRPSLEEPKGETKRRRIGPDVEKEVEKVAELFSMAGITTFYNKRDIPIATVMGY